MPQESPYEFSRPINATHLQADEPRTENIVANEKERASLAARFEILDVDSLQATITLTRMADEKNVILVTGHVTGAASQACVVTGEPVPETIDEEFETSFATESYVNRWLQEHPDDDLDAPELMENGYIDIGELATQYFSLGLDPYPRKPGLEFMDEAGDDRAKDNPFASLAVLKDKK